MRHNLIRNDDNILYLLSRQNTYFRFTPKDKVGKLYDLMNNLCNIYQTLYLHAILIITKISKKQIK